MLTNTWTQNQAATPMDQAAGTSSQREATRRIRKRTTLSRTMTAHPCETEFLGCDTEGEVCVLFWDPAAGLPAGRARAAQAA